MKLLFFALIVYLIASIPNALWIGKLFRNVDLRTKGSGNLGATNASRFLGAKLGALVLVLDVLKGFLPIFILKSYTTSLEISLLALIAIIGHSYSIYLKFTGGKSVAIMLGVYLALIPYTVIFGLLVFYTTMKITDYVALSSIFMSISFIPLSWFMYLNLYYTLLAFVVSLLIAYRHKSNIQRIINKEEPKHNQTKGK